MSRLVLVDTLCVEQIFVEVKPGSQTIIIAAVYIPPNSDPCVYEAHCLSVLSVWKCYPNAKGGRSLRPIFTFRDLILLKFIFH